MKTRIVIFSLVVCASIAVNTAFNVAVHPSISAATAVNQVLDNNDAVVLMRSYDRLANALPVVTWATVLLTGVALFAKPLYNMTKETQ